MALGVVVGPPLGENKTSSFGLANHGKCPYHGAVEPITIGIILNQLEGRYQAEFYHGCRSAARRLGVGLVFYLGGVPGDPHDPGQKGLAYLLPDASRIDGLLVAAAPLHAHLSPAEYDLILSSLPPVPQVYVSEPWGDHPFLEPDNAQGLNALVGHLWEEHGCRRFAFLAGNPAHKDAKERLKAFHDSLDLLGAGAEREVLQGIFTEPSGYQAVRDYVAARGDVPWDALVCANDEMAFGATRALLEAGIEVPRQVVVTGFDDLPEATLSAPPLTTVRQPIGEMAGEGLAMVLRMIRGEPVPRQARVGTRLVKRQSCGCLPLPAVGDQGGEFKGLLGTTLAADEAEEAVTVARRLVLTPGTNADYYRFHGFLARDYARGGGPAPWYRLLADLGRRVVEGQAQDAPAAQASLQRLHILVTGQTLNPSNQAFSNLYRKIFALKAALSKLAAAVSPRDLYAALGSVFPTLAISQAWLALYPEVKILPGRLPPLPPEIMLVFHQEGKQWKVHDDPPRVATARLLPEDCWERFAAGQGQMVVSPLFTLDEQYGLLMLELEDPRTIHDDTFMVDALQNQLGASLRTIRLFREKEAAEAALQDSLRKVQELSIRDELTGLHNRRGFRLLGGKQYEVARRDRLPLVLVFADMDGLKAINDGWGHEAGDRAIRAMARILEASFRSADILGRMGGDEFTAMLPGVTEALMKEKRRSLLRRVEAFNRTAKEPFTLSISLGIFCCGPADLDEPLDVHLARADELLYQEKRRRFSS